MADGFVALAVRRNTYVDSVTLLQVSAEVAGLAGVLDAALVMATELNRDVLRDSGLLGGDAPTASANDLIIAVRGVDNATAAHGLNEAEALLSKRRTTPSADETAFVPRSIRGAFRADPEANLAVISVPGPYAASEARQALADGLHVLLFSDNVSLEDEVDLKQRARERGLLVMGPDCGTSILNGVGLGFANVVRRGRVGLVGASGTGLQEVTSLLHQAGEGISHAIGTGSRDLHSAVGGITTLQALELLRGDPATEVIMLVGKPADPVVAETIVRAAADTRKPIVTCLFGTQVPPLDGVNVAHNLYQAARLAASSGCSWAALSLEDLPRIRFQEGQWEIRGLFCGGTLRYEADAAVGDAEHTFIDFGDDRYTRGRAHPMIDPSLRNHAIVEAGADPRVAVLLLDVILGRAAHPDPAGATSPAIRDAVARANAEGRQLTVVAHVVGTDRDPQGLSRQEAALRSAGVHVLGSNYHAAVAASLHVERVSA
jgi:FdrA protein